MRKEFLILTGIVIIILITSTVVNAESATQGATATVSVNEFISLTISPGILNFGDMNPGQINRDGIPLTASIGPETNVPVVHIFTRANNTNFYTVWGDHYFPVSNMKWSMTGGNNDYHDYLTANAEVTTGTAGHDYPIYHRMYVPLGQPQGLYTAGIIITATNTAEPPPASPLQP